jgi:hypothetical protein
MTNKSSLAMTLAASLLFGLASLVAAQTQSATALTQGATNFAASNSTQVVNVQQTGSGFAIKASTTSTGGVGAIFGQATATSGFNNGVWGRTFSPTGVAVRGEGMATTGSSTGVVGISDISRTGIGIYGHAKIDGIGILGRIDSLDNSGIGIMGRSGPTCCGIPGVFQQDAALTGGFPTILVGQYLDSNANVKIAFTVDPQGVYGSRFWATPDSFGDDLFIGRAVNDQSNVFRVDRSGAVFSDGGYHTGGADFAEAFSVKGETSAYAAGDVLTIDPGSTRRLTRTSTAYSTLVAGIYSTKPGVLASPDAMDQTPKSDVPLAVVGVVPCKVTSENGAIEAGDLLVSSSKEGYAMKGTDRTKMVGAVVGKALERLPQGDGTIQVLVTLQ